ncbi:MAG: PEP-CTERM sorting domain-containing protein [Chthoniobacteraceae bacterium]
MPAVLLALALTGQQAHAGPAAGGTWIGTNGSFATGSNWSTGAPPNAATSGTIDNGGTATVGSGVNTAHNLVIGEAHSGNLSISGGKLTDTTTSVVGDAATGNGAVTITSGSWVNSASLIVGNSGTGVLNIGDSSVTSNGVVNVASGAGVLQLGENAGSTGTLNFTAGKLQAASVNGGAGTGIVNFLNTTDITFAPQLTGSLAVTFDNSSFNTTTLTGSSNYTGTTTITENAIVTVSRGQLHNDTNSTLIVGAADGDDASLNITNDGYVSSNNVVIGNTANAMGSVVISSGTLNVTGSIQVGTGSQSSASVNGGGTIEVDAGGVLTIQSGTGALVLGGPGDATDFGSGGVGTLNYHGGTLNFAQVTTGSANSMGYVNIYTNSFAPQIVGGTNTYLAVSYLSGGTFVYSGSDNYTGNTFVDNGTTLEFSGGTFSLNNPNGPQLFIAIQDNDTGTVIITNNATVRANLFVVGEGVDSSGTLIINSGTLITDQQLAIGNQGSGVLNMTGGTIESGGVAIGSSPTGSATATISGGTWNDSNSFFSVGSTGQGVLNVQGGAVNEAGTFFIGVNQGVTGTVNVSSGTLAVDNFTIGDNGNGTLNVTGGLVTGTDSVSENYIGSNNTTFGLGVGVVNVSSGTFSVAGPLYIGFADSGTMNITGGTVNTSYVALGYYGDQGSGPAVGTATVSSGTWTSNDNIVVGDYGLGTLTISGGLVSPNGGVGSILLALNAGSSGVLNFSGGTLDAATVNGGAGTATVNFTTLAGGTSTFAPDITGAVAVNQTGAGGTVLTGNSSFSGTTTISAGTLTVNGSLMDTTTIVGTGTLNGSGTTSNVTVNNGGVLGGTLHSGVVTVTAGGKVTPGDAPGANTMTSLTLTGSATYQEQIVVPVGGSYTGTGNHPIAGVDYGQTTLTGSGIGQTVVSLDSTSAILQLNVTGPLPAGGLAITGNPYTPGASNSSLDNYFILHLSDGTDVSSGRFAEVTLDGVNFVTIDYSATNLVGGDGMGTFTLDGQAWVISYTGFEADNSTIGGDDVVLTAIPEPGTWGMMVVGVIGMLAVGKRRLKAKGAALRPGFNSVAPPALMMKRSPKKLSRTGT